MKLLVVLFMPVLALAQTRTEVLQHYRSMMQLDSTARNALFKMRIQPNWQADGRFWYSNNLKDSTTEYILVDPVKAIKRPAFDHQRLAAALKVTGRLTITRMVFENNKINLEYKSQWYTCDLTSYECTPINTAPAIAEIKTDPNAPPRWRRDWKRDSLSPDKQWVAFIKDNNVFIKSAADSTQVTQFTTDGSATQPYASLYWSPDSKYFVGYKTDPRTNKEVYYVLTSEPNTTRGILKSHGYAQPGDEFTSYEMVVFNLATKSL